MKRLFWATLFLALIFAVPVPTMAGVDINVNIGMPPLIAFDSPPEMIVMPETYAYAVPDLDDDLFFYNGWWWRPWQGQWYRSRHYGHGWGHYNRVPRFYYDIDPDWRRSYKDRKWHGKRWNYERIHHDRLQKNWKHWKKNRHWEKKGSWGVQDYKPRPQHQRQELRKQRQHEYEQRPEVQQHRQQPQHQGQQQQKHNQPEARKSGHNNQPEARKSDHKQTEGKSEEDKEKDHGRR